MTNPQRLEFKRNRYLVSNVFFDKNKNDAIRCYRLMKGRGEDVVLVYDGEYWRIFKNLEEI